MNPKEAKHTQGEWSVWTHDERLGEFEYVTDKNAKKIALHIDNPANARLIAAAPDLLAALKEAAGILEQYEWYAEKMAKELGRGFNPEKYPGELASPSKDARAAIAKATGETK